ncbi:S-DNA-T family DNA segregation ATPase FtsK/SpoIIIE [Rhizobium sp. PP-CC-2G-626]|nr:S-DNA-T family DNA segregation ATPase FtsK/SpoIIIE [Rhizobium sp. PP-CC-2G-626]
MDELVLIGEIACGVVERTLDAGKGEPGLVRFVMVGLSREEIVAIVSAIRAKPALARRLEIALPRYAFADVPDLDPALLTDAATTDLRHADSTLEGRVVALLDESQAQSLSQVDKFDVAALLNEESAERWIEVCSDGLAMPPEVIREWLAGLKALIRIDRVSMRQVAKYLMSIAKFIEAGQSVTIAFGSALPQLRLPRFDALFEEVPPAQRGQPSQWQKRFTAHWRRDCFVVKRDSNQIPFSTPKLREKLGPLREAFPDDVFAILQAYVESAPTDREAMFAPFLLDWSEIKTFFEEIKRNEAHSIGTETKNFYALKEAGTLADHEQVYLDTLVARGKNPGKNETDEEFYGAHAVELRENPHLSAIWDRFVFGAEIPCNDFIDGLLQCVRRLRPDNAAKKRVLVVEGVERSKEKFLGLNHEACSFFATRFKGLAETLVGQVTFRHVEAFKYDEFQSDISEHKRRTPGAISRKARQLHFRVSLEEDDLPGAPIRLVWEFNVGGVGPGLGGDLERLLDNRTKSPLVRCKAGTARVRTRGGPIGVSLSNLANLDPASYRDRGSFVPSSSKCESLAQEWKTALKKSTAEGLVNIETGSKLTALFEAFEVAYTLAIAEFLRQGAGAPSLAHQAAAYGALLDFITTSVKAPMALDGLLRPLVEIGCARIEGHVATRPTVIVCPWHPLRLEAQHGRLLNLKETLAFLLKPEGVHFTDGSGAMFFNEFRRNMRDPGRPELVLAWPASKAQLLAQVDTLNDFSLHEFAAKGFGGEGSTNENALPVARQIAELADQYLRLQPHEKDNLSVVLFNCDAAALPQAVVDSIRLDADRDGNDAMCQVILRHTDEEQLRSVYQQIVMRELENDSLYASEATRDFMSRLRISIMVNQQAPAISADGPPYDIVFCHDVVSRQAELGWVDVRRIVRPASSIDMAQWSKRKPIGKGERDAVLYLTSPAQTETGWFYLDALATISQSELAVSAKERGFCRIPVRQTDVLSDQTRQILEETHRLGNWVVNFDDLLDRKQLRNNSINVIRYKHADDGGRSIIISSRTSDALLRSTLLGRLRGLSLPYDSARLNEVARQLIADANLLSGDIVLRAAKRGTNASELIGVVLSQFLVEAELGLHRPISWIFLDDYASWLGQSEQRIADLLCLAPRFDDDGKPCLDIIVTEAKYVGVIGSEYKAAHSARQLSDTLKALESALLHDRRPADREIWLARLSEMLVDGLRDGAGSDYDWRTAVRDGLCKIDVKGYSHVFTHGTSDLAAGASDSFRGVLNTETGHQEVFAPSTVAAIVSAYAELRDPTEFRQIDGTVGSSVATPMSALESQVVERTLSTIIHTSAATLSTENPSTNAEVPAEAGRVEPSHFRRLLLDWFESDATSDDDEAWLEEISLSCRNALLRYGMSARLEQKVLTPNAALLKFKGADDLTVAKVENKSTELETTHGIELFNVRAEPGRVVLSIRRPRRRLLTLAEVWKDWRGQGETANTRLLIAVKEDDGQPLYLEPEPAPHTLVAGSTGSGKSVLVQNIILGIAATNREDQAKIVLIDPKAGVDYFPFDRLPHLDGPIIDDQNVALQKLDELVGEMERRYAFFKAARVSNIKAYNRTGAPSLPLIWLVHDEFADWMQIDTYKAGVEAAVSRLGVKARAAGIYLIFAAQRPDSSVFPMQLRSNLGNRLVLRVDSAGTSDLSLGVKGGGAEKLLGKGHLAAILGGGTDPIYAQVPYISEERLEQLVTALIEDQTEQV